jgi:hypothetical protein
MRMTDDREISEDTSLEMLGRLLVYAVVLAAIILSIVGCAGGLQGLSAEQLKSMPGVAACSSYKGMYGQTTTVVVAAEDVRKGATSKGRVQIAPDCTISIEDATGVAP